MAWPFSTTGTITVGTNSTETGLNGSVFTSPDGALAESGVSLRLTGRVCLEGRRELQRLSLELCDDLLQTRELVLYAHAAPPGIPRIERVSASTSPSRIRSVKAPSGRKSATDASVRPPASRATA